ncbi:MAG: LysM peptidoglycan-binding domain-containing protein [Nitrospirae bacterium]|nr:MAG: LysM peptidoglycan-binding domain-containing protein [Nitrospirota bacterium]
MKKLPIFLLPVLFFIFSQTSYAQATLDASAEEVKQVESALPTVPEEKTPLVIALHKEEAVPTPQANRGTLIPDVDSNKVASRAVEKNLGLFSKRIKERFSLYLSRSGQYLELMKGLLRSKDVPEDIVFLSLIESGFNPNAYSIARAAGPWQFISSTAKRYGLQINWWKDERRDPVKSTLAAADYLKDLYGMFGSWSLAMAAYNAGEGKISRAIKRNKSDDYWDLLDTRHIRNETKEYVPRFIAASMIASNPEDFGFEGIEYHQPMSYDEVQLKYPIDLTVAAECAGTDLETIKKLNPELRRWCTPPDVPHYVLRVPKGSKEAFLENLAMFPEDERFTIEKYTVKKGDTLKKIAKRTGVPEQAILSLNDMEKIMPLAAGHVVYLPPKALYVADADDRHIKKASYKVKRKGKRSSSKKR